MVEGQVVQSLFVTLRRSYAGTPWFHRRILQALGLRRRHQCLEKPNNESIRGMLMKVPHLVVVETDRMFYLRGMRDYHQQLCRPPLVVTHEPPALPTTQEPHLSQFARQTLVEHVLPRRMEGFGVLHRPAPPTRDELQAMQAERVHALNVHGLFSRRVRELNERDMQLAEEQLARNKPREKPRAKAKDKQ